eukprot:m.302298 g.302298  ORF g.302298 m.302298 type:complete len:297 (-) comp15117_c0_seq1:138-1028(-)
MDHDQVIEAYLAKTGFSCLRGGDATANGELKQTKQCVIRLPESLAGPLYAHVITMDGTDVFRVCKSVRVQKNFTVNWTPALFSGAERRVFLSDCHSFALVVTNKKEVGDIQVQPVAIYTLPRPEILKCSRCDRLNGAVGRGVGYAPVRKNGICSICQAAEKCEDCGDLATCVVRTSQGQLSLCHICAMMRHDEVYYLAGFEHRNLEKDKAPYVDAVADEPVEGDEDGWEDRAMPAEHTGENSCRGCGKFFRYIAWDCDTCSDWGSDRYRLCCQCREDEFHTAHHMRGVRFHTPGQQ